MTHKISRNKSRNLYSKFHPIQKKYTQATEDRCHEHGTCEVDKCLLSTSSVSPEIPVRAGKQDLGGTQGKLEFSEAMKLFGCSDNFPPRHPAIRNDSPW